MLAEGPTEERFIKDVLSEHFWGLGLHLAPTVLATKRVKSGGGFRGGVTSFGKFENDARRLLGSAGGALLTTMLDYYRLPEDFPGMNTRPLGSPAERVSHVESAIHQHFGSPPNLLPYLSLHEFEALLFASPDELPRALTQTEKTDQFVSIRAAFPTPEDIDEQPDQAPSKRIEKIFPAYRKTFHGPTTTKRIGLDRLRNECPHFNEWITRLEAFARGS